MGRGWLPLGVGLFGLGFSCWPTWSSGFAWMQTDAGDTVLNHYFLEHAYRCVCDPDYLGSAWSPRFFYPTPGVLAYSDNLWGTAPLYIVLRQLWCDTVAFQCWMLLCHLLNYVVMYGVLRWFGLRQGFAAVGGFWFAFGLPHVHQFYHQQLFPRFFMPLAVWHLWRMLQQPSSQRLALLLLCAVWQILAGIYLGWFLGIGLAILAAWNLLLSGEVRQRCWHYGQRAWGMILLQGVVSALILAPVLYPYIEVNHGFERSLPEVLYGAPQWRSWLTPAEASLWHPLLMPLWGEEQPIIEHHIFGGFALYALVPVALWAIARQRLGDRQQTRLVATCMLSAATLAAVSLNVGDVSAWSWVYDWVPGAKAIRAVLRIYIIIDLFLIIGGLMAVQAIWDRQVWSARTARWVGVVLLAWVAVENFRWHIPGNVYSLAAFPKVEFYGRAKRWAEAIRGADAAYFPHDPQAIPLSYEHHLSAMWAGLYANVPVVNGYSGRYPPNYNPDQQHRFSGDDLRAILGQHWPGRLRIVTTSPILCYREWTVDSLE